MALRIRVARSKRGLTLEQVARGADCSVMSLRRWEEGRTGPPSTQIGGLADALSVPRAWLVDGKPPDPFPVLPGDDPKGFPYRLREARVSRGLTQEQLGVLAGFPAMVIAAWEAGETGWLKEHVSAFARLLDVRTQWLNGRSDHGGLRPPL